jgi:hypothetical protein
MSSSQLPVASDLIDGVLGEIFGPSLRLIRRDIHDVDSIRSTPSYFSLKVPKKNCVLNGGRDQSIEPPRVVSSTLHISADPAGVKL